MSEDKLKTIIAKGRLIRNKYRQGKPIKDCEVNTWIRTECIDNKLYIYPDSDSLLIAGILAIIKEINDGRNCDNDLTLTFFDDVKAFLPEQAVGLLNKIQQLLKIKTLKKQI